ncbi:50S ribosomal protein L33 [Mesotoga sp. UBA5557]|jgi:large subunit ribosomal protein L33|uniref:50S ribosomal protein L33 n=1 Tax=Mesotoga sp. UBA5557 TaxID=1946857 RepID=UPI0025E16528|nr:50S ribosomal protein L33 [Mesotoga sp. UBA5557]
MAKKTKGNKVLVTLKCSECGTRNYYRFKNRQKKYKLDASKYCPKCRKHTEHKESK